MTPGSILSTEVPHRQPGALGDQLEGYHGPVENFRSFYTVEVSCSDSYCRIGVEGRLDLRAIFRRWR